MSTSELSDLFELHLAPRDASLPADELQRTLEAAVAEAAQDTAEIQRVSADLQETMTDEGQFVSLLHVVLAKEAPAAAARAFIETHLTPQLEKRDVMLSQVRQRNTSGDNI